MVSRLLSAAAAAVTLGIVVTAQQPAPQGAAPLPDRPRPRGGTGACGGCGPQHPRGRLASWFVLGSNDYYVSRATEPAPLLRPPRSAV